MKLLPVLLLCASLHPARPQHRLLLRPAPSDHLPVPGLQEDPHPDYDPRRKDLAESALRKKLGRHFDPDFMATAAPNLSASVAAAAEDESALFLAELRRLNLSSGAGAPPHGLRIPAGRGFRRKLARTLWAHTRCPVAYAWRDVGARFWPRYVKEGRCVAERSCSIPRGMSCRAARSVAKTLLRWHCQGFQERKHCAWIPVHYPIVSRCTCSC